MKQKWKIFAMLCITLALGIVFAGCPQVTELSSSVELGSLTIAGKPVTLGTPSDNWLTAKEPANIGTVYLTAGEMVDAAVVTQKGQEGQIIYMASAKPDVMPNFVENTTFTFEARDFLWVEVFSENHDAYNLYAVQVRTSTPAVLDISYGDRSASGGFLFNGQPVQKYGNGLGTFGATLAEAREGEVWFGNSQANTALAVTVTPEDPATTVLVASGAANASEASLFPANYTNPSPFEFTAINGNYLYLKSVSADAQAGTVYYKVKLVEKSDDLAISGVTIQANSETAVAFGVGAMGTKGFGGSGGHDGGAELAETSGFVNILGSGTSAAVTVNIETAPQGATIRYGHTDFFNAQEGVDSAGYITLNYQESNVLSGVKAGEYIAVEVTNGLGDKGWYAFRVAIGAHTDITGLTVGGTSITFSNAKNTDPAGTTFVEYKPNSKPTDNNGNGLWDSFVIAAIGFDSNAAGIEVAFTDYVGTADLEWISATNGNYTFQDAFGSGNYVIIRVKNNDALDYYYKVKVLYGRSEATITGINFGGVESTNLGTPGDEVPSAEAPASFGAPCVSSDFVMGSITLTGEQAEAAKTPTGISVTGLPEGASVDYIVPLFIYGDYYGYNEEDGFDWSTTGEDLFRWHPVTDNPVVLIRVMSEDRGVRKIYVIQCTVSN